MRIGRHKPRTRHELVAECLLVVFQRCLPTSLPDNYSMTNLLRVRQKFIEPNRYRRLRKIAVGRLIHAIDKITSLLKFD